MRLSVDFGANVGGKGLSHCQRTQKRSLFLYNGPKGSLLYSKHLHADTQTHAQSRFSSAVQRV